MYSVYKCLRILSLAKDGYNAPTIVKLLVDEDLKIRSQGVLKFQKKYEATGTIDYEGRRNGRKTKLTSEIKSLIDNKMESDDEATLKELQQMLSQSGHKLARTTILKGRKELGWTNSKLVNRYLFEAIILPKVLRCDYVQIRNKYKAEILRYGTRMNKVDGIRVYYACAYVSSYGLTMGVE